MRRTQRIGGGGGGGSSRLTLEECTAPAYGIQDAPLPLQDLPDVPDSEVVAALRVLGKYVLELLRQEAALGVVCARVAAVLVPVDTGQVDAEEGVRQPARRRRVREITVDDQHGHQSQEVPEAQLAKPDEGVPGPDYAVVVLRNKSVDALVLASSGERMSDRIEELAMLLQYLFKAY